MNRLRTGVGLAALAAACLVGFLVALTGVLTVTTGWERVVLVSGSMSPRLVPGDVIFADRVDHPVDAGTVLVFHDPASEGMLTHRVVEVLPDGSYRTQGDANASPDSTPVPPADVIGSGRMLVPWVGLPTAWLQTGRAPHALALLVGLGLVGGASRWAWPPAPVDPKSARRPWRARRAGVATTAGVSVVVLLSGIGGPGILEPSRAGFTAPTTSAGNSVSVTSFLRLYLKTSAAGDVPPSPTLPLSPTAPTATTLPNYDVGRNSAPGLTISRGGTLDTLTPSQIQKWAWTVPSTGVTFTSRTRVRLWSAMTGFQRKRDGSVQIQAYDCDSLQLTCTEIGSTATVTSTGGWSAGSSTWVAKSWNLGHLGSLAAGRVLQLRVVVLAESATDMMFAYDTTAYPADLAAE